MDDVAPSAEPVTKLVSPAASAAANRSDSRLMGGTAPRGPGPSPSVPAQVGGIPHKSKGKAPASPPTPSAPPTPAVSASVPPPHSGGPVPQGGAKGSSTPSYTTTAAKPAKAKPAKAALLTPKQAWACPKAKPNTPPPSRLSLVLCLSDHSHDEDLRTAAGVLAPAMVHICNDALAANPTFASVRMSAARWTPKGNLVVFSRPDTMYEQLLAASSLLTTAVADSLPDGGLITSCLNVCWGKVLINGVPTGITEENPTAHSPTACMQEIITNNPIFRSLKVT